MHKYLSEYPPAPISRIEDAIRIFPYKSISAEEYAAREGHKWGSFSFGEYVYPDRCLNEWIHTLDDILFTPGCLAATRERLLTKEELEKIYKESNDV